LFWIFISCTSKEHKKRPYKKHKDIQSKVLSWKVDLDSILERTDPRTLDLNKHQLFIDTTRNSEFYQKYSERKLNKHENRIVEQYFNEISKKYKPKKIDIGKFSKQWVSLKKLNNKFVIYDPCDGNTLSYEITENAVIFYHQLESDLDVIFNLDKLSCNSIELELRTTQEKIKSEKPTLSIKPTGLENVYLLTYNMEKQFVTPREKVSKFDLVVNHCPKIKAAEFNGFDKE